VPPLPLCKPDNAHFSASVRVAVSGTRLSDSQIMLAQVRFVLGFDVAPLGFTMKGKRQGKEHSTSKLFG